MPNGNWSKNEIESQYAMYKGETDLFLFFLRLYLFTHERRRGWAGQRYRQREKQAPCREPDVGLDPESPGSHPGLKAALDR